MKTKHIFYGAILTLVIVGIIFMSEFLKEEPKLDTEKIAQLLVDAQSEDGSFILYNNEGSLSETHRVLKALKELDTLQKIDKEKAIQYVMSSYRADGSFGGILDSYYALKSLSFLDSLDVLDKDKTISYFRKEYLCSSCTQPDPNRFEICDQFGKFGSWSGFGMSLDALRELGVEISDFEKSGIRRIMEDIQSPKGFLYEYGCSLETGSFGKEKTSVSDQGIYWGVVGLRETNNLDLIDKEMTAKFIMSGYTPNTVFHRLLIDSIQPIQTLQIIDKLDSLNKRKTKKILIKQLEDNDYEKQLLPEAVLIMEILS